MFYFMCICFVRVLSYSNNFLSFIHLSQQMCALYIVHCIGFFRLTDSMRIKKKISYKNGICTGQPCMNSKYYCYLWVLTKNLWMQGPNYSRTRQALPYRFFHAAADSFYSVSTTCAVVLCILTQCYQLNLQCLVGMILFVSSISINQSNYTVCMHCTACMQSK